jgi:hypothetical protein
MLASALRPRPPRPGGRAYRSVLWRYLWAAPTSVLGLGVVALTWPRLRIVHGVLEASGPRVAATFDLVAPGRSIAAMTLGHVVLGRCLDALDETRAHERVHVAQCERWGPLFVPAYLAASAHAWWRGADPYVDNVFEQEAFGAIVAMRPGANGRLNGEPMRSTIAPLDPPERPRALGV